MEAERGRRSRPRGSRTAKAGSPPSAGAGRSRRLPLSGQPFISISYQREATLVREEFGAMWWQAQSEPSR